MLGFTQENGPFSIASGATSPTAFTENEWSWNNEANVLYIEQPAGVGFSYCSGVQDCSFTDHSSAQDNLDTILAWYEKYPDYKENELFISGESYGGIYVPYMAYFIDKFNEDHASDDSFKPNLKGFAVGNGVTNWKYDTTAAFVDMGYWHSLYDTALHNQFKDEECDFTGPYMQKTSDTCMSLLNEFDGFVEYVNVYDIFGTCWGRGSAPQTEASKTNTQWKPRKSSVTAHDYTPWAKRSNNQSNELPPCTWGSPLIEYLNSDEVRQNLHIPSSIQAWDLCTS